MKNATSPKVAAFIVRIWPSLDIGFSEIQSSLQAEIFWNLCIFVCTSPLTDLTQRCVIDTILINIFFSLCLV